MLQRTNEKKTNAGYEVEHTNSVISKFLNPPMFRIKNGKHKMLVAKNNMQILLFISS